MPLTNHEDNAGEKHEDGLKVTELTPDSIAFKPVGQAIFFKFTTMAAFDLWRNDQLKLKASLERSMHWTAEPMGFWARRALADFYFFVEKHGYSMLPQKDAELAKEIFKDFAVASYEEDKDKEKEDEWLREQWRRASKALDERRASDKRRASELLGRHRASKTRKVSPNVSESTTDI